MSILPKLASSIGRRDTIPNKELAEIIAASNDKKSVKELVENLHHKDKNIQSDCIKVLYETGERNPALLGPYDKEFIALLDHKNNRLVWGAMAALDCIASINPKGIYAKLAKILNIAEKGSVITRDHGINILLKLAVHKEYTNDCLTLFLDQIKDCPTNQFPKYAEDALPVLNDKFKPSFLKILTSRLPEIDSESKRKRVEKVIRKC